MWQENDVHDGYDDHADDTDDRKDNVGQLYDSP